MKHNKFASVFLTVLALVLAVTTAAASFLAMGREPVVTMQPQQPRVLAEAFMDAVCAGEFDTASQMLRGTPNLGTDREPADEVGKIFWEAYLESLSYEVCGECYGAKDGLALDLEVTYLDFMEVMEDLRENTSGILAEHIRQAENPSDVYDSQNNYRQDLVDQVLQQSARSVLKGKGKVITEKLTLRMISDGEKWWVLPDSDLIRMISGGSMERG